jgi:hypothetical protein
MPIAATAVYAYASLLAVIAIVPYLFDVYTAPGTLSPLTIAAVARILLGVTISLVIVHMVMRLTGAWALSLFGFVGVAFAAMPFALFLCGRRWRMKSAYAPRMEMAKEECVVCS